MAQFQHHLGSSHKLLILGGELKVGGSRRSILIPIGRLKNGWRTFRLELRKMLDPNQFVEGYSGHSKSVAQPHTCNSKIQISRSFAKMVQGHHVQVKARKH